MNDQLSTHGCAKHHLICIFREAALLDCEESLKQEEKKRSEITSSQKPKEITRTFWQFQFNRTNSPRNEINVVFLHFFQSLACVYFV